MPEAHFLKILWFVAGLGISGIVWLVNGEKWDNQRRAWYDTENHERLALAAIPFMIFLVLYILARAIAVSGAN